MNSEDGKSRKSRNGARPPRDASALSRMSGKGLSLDESLVSDLSSRVSVRQSLRAQHFAHGVLTKYHGLTGPCALKFLSEYYGTRFSCAEMGRLAGEKLYRKTGSRARGPTTQTRPNFSLTLNITPHTLASHQKLVGLLPARETVTPGRGAPRGGLRLMPVAQEAERSLVSPERARRRSRAQKELLTVHEKIAREIFSKVKMETLRERDAYTSLITLHAPGAGYLPPGAPNISLTRPVQTLLISQPTRTTPVTRTPRESPSPSPQPAIAPKLNLITRAYVSPQSSGTVLLKAILRETATSRERTRHPVWMQMPERLERIFLSKVRREERGGPAPSGKRFPLPRMAHLHGSNPSDFISPVRPVRNALYENPLTGAVAAKTPALPLTFRSGMTLTESYLTRRAGLLPLNGARASLISEPHADLERVLVTLRRESRLELPPVARVFAAQPQRAVAEAESVVKQVEEKEMIETIRREVTTQMKSYRADLNFTRADFTAITDHVYDALARRLLYERERLGLNP